MLLNNRRLKGIYIFSTDTIYIFNSYLIHFRSIFKNTRVMSIINYQIQSYVELSIGILYYHSNI